MFETISRHMGRLIFIYAVGLNAALAAAFAVFLFEPQAALAIYSRFIGWGSPAFIGGLVAPSFSDSWFVAFALANATWVVPWLALFAVSLIYTGVRPELAKHGLVALGRGTATRIDDSVAWFGITNGALVGIAMLGGLASAITFASTSDWFQSFAHKKNLQGASIGSGIAGYREFVRSLIGTQTSAPAQPASAPSPRKEN